VTVSKQHRGHRGSKTKLWQLQGSLALPCTHLCFGRNLLSVSQQLIQSRPQGAQMDGDRLGLKVILAGTEKLWGPGCPGAKPDCMEHIVLEEVATPVRRGNKRKAVFPDAGQKAVYTWSEEFGILSKGTQPSSKFQREQTSPEPSALQCFLARTDMGRGSWWPLSFQTLACSGLRGRSAVPLGFSSWGEHICLSCELLPCDCREEPAGRPDPS
jgi:hypothetical protein